MATAEYSIYRIVCFMTGRCYVGQTKNTKHRRAQHFSRLRHGKHHSALMQSDHDIFGIDSFYFEVLERDLTINEVDQQEIYWTAKFSSYENGYNNTAGGRLIMPCTWNGIEYPSIRAAGRALGLDDETMRMRFSKGYKCDDDMPGQGSNQQHCIPCLWEGIEYPSIIAAAAALGVSRMTMKNRVQKGYTCEQDLTDANKRRMANVRKSWGYTFGRFEQAGAKVRKGQAG